MYNKNHNHMIYGSWDTEWDTNFFVILGHFLPFYLPPNDPEYKNFEKMKKMPGDVNPFIHMFTINEDHMIYGSWNIRSDRQKFSTYHLTHLHQNENFQKNGKNTWRYYHFKNINNSHMMYGSSDMECNRHNFLSFWTIFALLPRPNNPKNQNFEKMKKLPGDIIILQRCNINDNHMMYGSWDTECHRQNFLSFWTIFCPFTPITTSKNQNLKK